MAFAALSFLLGCSQANSRSIGTDSDADSTTDAAGGTDATALRDPKNIVLILVDDWPWNGSPVAMDGTMANARLPLLRMPNLSKLADEGEKFQNAYAAAPQCAPSRVSIQTGKTTARTGFTVTLSTSDYYDTDPSHAGFPVVPNGSDSTIDADATTIPEALGRVNQEYVSAHFGKWHMGGDPAGEGYSVHDGPTTNDEGNENLPGDPKRMFSITARALAFMEEQAQANRPFYLQISHYAMHEGRACLPETRAKYQRLPEVVALNGGETDPDKIENKKDPAVWLGMGEDLDGRIGAVLKKIDDLGIADKTYVVVVGDNGYRLDAFDELSGLGQPLHGAKWWAWQGGLRVPMLVKGPDIQGGSVSAANVVHYDLLPTFVEWAGGDPTTELTGIDGVSLAGLMRGEPPSDDFLNRSLYFHYPHYRNSMPHSAIVSGRYKVMYFYETPIRFESYDPIMLFSLGRDPGETKNVTENDPTVAQGLYHEMMRYFNEVGARMPELPNPDYDPAVYESDALYQRRLLWGPFEGTRRKEDDER